MPLILVILLIIVTTFRHEGSHALATALQGVELIEVRLLPGYREEVVAVAGYRIYTNLFMGKHLYVDDLSTAARCRSRGYGEQMIKWLREQAIEAGCNYLHLDSGVQRGSAHKFYFNQGFTIASYHFSEPLKPQQ